VSHENLSRFKEHGCVADDFSRKGRVGADLRLRCSRRAVVLDRPGPCLRTTSARRHWSNIHKNPKAPPGPTNDIAHWTVDKGKAGLDGPGDSIAIEGAAHKKIRSKKRRLVSRQPATELAR
jgi:hypothetical protein